MSGLQEMLLIQLFLKKNWLHLDKCPENTKFQTLFFVFLKIVVNTVSLLIFLQSELFTVVLSILYRAIWF